jgi:hypothetical protein
MAKKSKAQPSVKVRDLKPAKNPKGGYSNLAIKKVITK